ncbi:MAG: DMT family transporter [Desulfobacterales bacterium]|nr:DMT family transporter [Desulfobacterales bacterium]
MTPRAHLKGDLLLLLTAMIWGSAFVAQKVGMDHIGPFMYTGIRFALGALFLTPVMLVLDRYRLFVVKKQESTPYLIAAGLLAGVLLFAGSILQQIGLVYTTAGKAGFITGLYVVIVPLLGLIWKIRPGAGGWAGALLSVTGLYLLTVQEGFYFFIGDILVIICAFMYAFHVLAIGWFAPRLDVLKLSLIQFWTCSVISLAAGLVIEPQSWQAVYDAAVPIIYGGLLSVGIGFTLQVVAQQKAPPHHAAIILSLETVFAVMAGMLVLGETLPARGWAGAALMLSGMLLSQFYTGRK